MHAVRRRSSCSTWIRGRARPTASRKAAPTTAILVAPVITRCSCSANSAIWRCALRSGNVHSADGWRAVLEPVIARYRGMVKRRYFRGDAAFANPEIYEFRGDGVRDPVVGQPGLAGQDRIPAEAPGRATAARGATLLPQLQLSGAELEKAEACRGKGRMACERALSPRQLYRRQPWRGRRSASSPSTT